MSDTKLLCWVDVESTGTFDNELTPTALEISWTLTDLAGEQLTGLAQAFTALPMAFGPLVLPSPEDEAADPGDTRTWWGPAGYPLDVVRDMHETNGLTREWCAMREQRPDRILQSWEEFERVMLDDLATTPAYLTAGPGEIVLAGGGVSHYEHHFLPGVAPRVFADPRFHYATTDVSAALRVLHNRDGSLPKKADEVIRDYGPRADRQGVCGDWPHIGLHTRYDADDRCGQTLGEPSPHWAVMESDPHRAAPGVARALMAYRLLPEVVKFGDRAGAGLPATTS